METEKHTTKISKRTLHSETIISVAGNGTITHRRSCNCQWSQTKEINHDTNYDTHTKHKVTQRKQNTQIVIILEGTPEEY